MDETHDNVVIPVIGEELHADAVPVETGGVRITKHVKGHEEILEQELRKGRVEIKRIKTDRVVDGPQPVRRVGNKLIIPVVSEVLHVEKRWVVTEEIHLTQIEERETVREKVMVNREEAQIERLDKEGNAVSTGVEPQADDQNVPARLKREGLLERRTSSETKDEPSARRKVLSGSKSILKNRPHH
ncbi:MAG: DUF2382 domain-containing protein [Acidobacteriaceae bacterium]|nr:DUF2382 domain-containing protein [Acidobacteriaceae bacterium]MBV9780564.1 DUF2382 domain-containing protein [Acidobacteriaceae bacterium]